MNLISKEIKNSGVIYVSSYFPYYEKLPATHHQKIAYLKDNVMKALEAPIKIISN